MPIIGITGRPLTGQLDGKTTVARFLALELGLDYLDLMEPVIAVYRSLFEEDLPFEQKRFLINRVCEMGRKYASDFWFRLFTLSIPKDKLSNCVLDNLFFHNEYLFVKNSEGFVLCVTSESEVPDLEFVPDLSCRKQDSEKKLKDRVLRLVQNKLSN